MLLVTSVACAAPLHIDVLVRLGLLQYLVDSFSSYSMNQGEGVGNSRSSSLMRARVCDVTDGEDIGISWIVDLECFQGLDKSVVFDRAG